MKKVFLKPRTGLKVLFPGRKAYIPEEGIPVKLNSDFQRLVNSGDLVIVEKPEKQTKKDKQKG